MASLIQKSWFELAGALTISWPIFFQSGQTMNETTPSLSDCLLRLILFVKGLLICKRSKLNESGFTHKKCPTKVERPFLMFVTSPQCQKGTNSMGQA